MEKTKQLKVRLSESQHSEIKTNVEILGVSISEFVLRRCLNLKFDPAKIPTVVVKKEVKTVFAKTQQADPLLILEVNKIGNNLNQLARALNSQREFDPTALLLELASISKALRELENVE